uniref:F-box domain-containing protein n=1 Tax=Setaria italica TaxID=4555 RepID=K3XRM6_SETIT
MNWAGLHADILESISARLTEPKDFISFRAVCPQWRETITRTAHARFLPWILKSDEVGVSVNVLFYSLSSEKYQEIHVPALKGRRTRLAGFGAGHLIGIDVDDDLSAVLVNPLTGESTALPRLPERFRGTITYGFAADHEMLREDDVSVAIYNWWPTGHVRIQVALWRRRGGHGWAVLPSERFWTRMPKQRSRLAAHGPEVLEGEIAGDGEEGEMEMQWVHDMDGAHLMEHGGQLRDKVIFQSADTCCHVLPAGDNFVGLSKNSIYFLDRRRRRGDAEAYCLCKWDLLQRVATVVEEIPGDWDWNLGRWFLPTLKY